MAGRGFVLGAKRLAKLTENVRLFNRSINRLAKVNSELQIYTELPDNLTVGDVKKSISNKSDYDSWIDYLQSFSVKYNKEQMVPVQTSFGTVNVPKPKIDSSGNARPINEYEHALEEKRRQNKRARKVQKEQNVTGMESDFAQEWSDDDTVNANDVYKNNASAISNFEFYLYTISENDDDGILAETVEIVNWLMENRPDVLTRIMESGEPIPTIEYLYRVLMNYSNAKGRSASRVKSRRTKNGETSLSNAYSKLNQINSWWISAFHKYTGQNWANVEDESW